MKRAALYARYSSDKQNELSARDQLALCESWAQHQGLTIVEVYTDEALSGASIVNRPGLTRLLADARERRFDVVVCEAIDRLSRHQADIHSVRRELAWRDIDIMTPQDGTVTAMHAGLKGLMSELFLVDLAAKVKRGQSARVREGKSGGGKSYGYMSAAAAGTLSIIAAEAAIVRRIFAQYADGMTPREIAARLNADRIPSPRGGKWNASTINGNPKRLNGILQNRLYVGEIVWNRQRFKKDPATGKRVSVLNPEGEWMRKDVPELAIVDRDLFDRAGRIKATKGQAHPSYARRVPYVFSGIVKCGCCGGGYTSIAMDRIGCSAYREQGTCTNNRTISRKELHARVLSGLREHLADPELISAYVRKWVEEDRRLRAEDRHARGDVERRLARNRAAVRRIIDAIENGAPFADYRDRSHELEAERIELEARLAHMAEEDKVIAVHPGLADVYRRYVEDLSDPAALSGDDNRVVMDKVRQLVDRIVITPPANAKAPVEIEVHGALAAILSISTGASPPIGGGKVVAGAGFEPATFRL